MHLDLNHNQNKLSVNLNLSIKDRNSISELIADKYPFKKVEKQEGNVLKFSPNETNETIVNKLATDGFYVLENKLSDELCEELKSRLEKIPYRIRGFKKDIVGINHENISKHKANAIWAINQNDIVIPI